MDYKKYGDTVYARFDRGDEIITGILDICKKENILSATYSGIGGCGEVTVGTLMPETNEYMKHHKSGILLEMISFIGNISSEDNDKLKSHAHAIFSYLDENNELKFIGGHLLDATVLYTAEIEIRPVQNGVIGRKFDETTGIKVWDL